MRFRRIQLDLVVTAALFACVPSASQAVFINFDQLPRGAPTFELNTIGDAYFDAYGISFGTLDANGQRSPTFRTVSGIGQSPSLGAADFARTANSTEGFHIFATFDNPALSITFDTFGPSPSEFLVQAIAMDAFGTPLGQVTSTSVFGTFKGQLRLSGLGAISSVIWKSTDPFVASVSIDNLSIQFVPEPGSALLVGLGLFALGVQQRPLWSAQQSR